jgi:hypothetical protein
MPAEAEPGRREPEMDQFELEPETKAMLDGLRSMAGLLPVYDLESTLVEQAVAAAGLPIVTEAGVRMVTFNQFRWFLRELARVFRTKMGWDLAFEMEVLLRKWHGYGLDPHLMQLVVRKCREAAETPPEVEDEAETQAASA